MAICEDVDNEDYYDDDLYSEQHDYSEGRVQWRPQIEDELGSAAQSVTSCQQSRASVISENRRKFDNDKHAVQALMKLAENKPENMSRMERLVQNRSNSSFNSVDVKKVCRVCHQKLPKPIKPSAITPSHSRLHHKSHKIGDKVRANRSNNQRSPLARSERSPVYGKTLHHVSYSKSSIRSSIEKQEKSIDMSQKTLPTENMENSTIKSWMNPDQ